MKKYRIGLLTGDGTGPLFCSSSKTILSGLAERFGFKVSFEELPFGKQEYLQNGDPLPSKTIDGIRKADASILFAVDGSEIPGPTPVGRLRKELGFYAEVRAVRSVPGYREGIDLVFVRELTEGFLCDRNTPSGRAEWKVDDDTAFSLRVIRRGSSSRIASYAFSYAKDMGYKKVTAVHKASIFKYTCGLFLECCREEAKKYPDIIYEEMTADDVAGDLVTSPEKFGVVLTTNMFGDILSDEGAALVGGICAGINIGKESVAFTIASTTAAIAGWLYAGLYGALFPDYFNMDLSVLFMCIVIVGGQGTILGPIIGAFVVVYGRELLANLGEGQMLVYGIILVFLCVVQPSGLYGLFSKGFEKVKKALSKKKEVPENGR